MNIDSVMQDVDGLFQRGEYERVEPFLLVHIAQAEAEDDGHSVLSLLNELMGYYRSTSRFRDSLEVASKALMLLDRLGLKDSRPYATTMLNIATAWSANGQTQRAIRAFEEVGRLFLALQVDDVFLVATLYNNLAMAWQEAGDHAKAMRFLKAALPLSRSRPGAEHDVAVSLTNLALSCTCVGELVEARAALEEAISLFDALPRPSGHAAAAIAGLAQVCYREGRLTEAAALYERALADIAPRYGHNQPYADMLDSLALVLEASDRPRSAQLMTEAACIRARLHAAVAEPQPAVQGLELARRYFETYRGELLANLAPVAQRIAVGLVGHGSECFGFDDALSRDHDFGPGFCVWLSDEDYAAFGAQLQTGYAHLPREFAGVPPRRASPRSGQRVGVFRIGDFYRSFLGAPQLPVSEADWLQIPEEALACACNGAVFRDPLGAFSSIRNALLAYYPDGILRRTLAQAIASMAQSGQYNLPRALGRNEPAAALLAQADFLRHTCAAIHVLNRRYTPPPKWLHRSVASLPRLAGLHAPLARLAQAAPADAAAIVEELCAVVLAEVMAQGFSQPGSDFLEAHVDTILGGSVGESHSNMRSSTR
jgi:tetratricopeptide (TPR) repeat protein